MDCEARRKERKYISSVEARAYEKLEAKARSGHDLEEQRLRWKGGRVARRDTKGKKPTRRGVRIMGGGGSTL